MWLLLHVTLLLPVIIIGLPTHHLGKSAALSASFDTTASKPLFSFDNGNVGVNFLGYHASAGLGGLLSGDAARGGLHAEAGTPHGQSAGAGLAGGVDGRGNESGYSYHFAKGFGPLDILPPFLRRRLPQTTEVPEELPQSTQTPEQSEVESFME